MEKGSENFTLGQIEITENNDTEYHYLGPHLRSLEDIGVTRDYFNAVPVHPENDMVLDNFIKQCVEGRKENYSQRYKGSPTVLGKSDPEKVKQIDKLMDEAIVAAKSGDRETVVARLKELQSFNPPPK